MLSDLPQQHYAAILADPPWQFKSYTALQSQNWESRRDVEKHYQVMGSKEIGNMPVRNFAAPDCHLFLWVSSPNLISGLRVMRRWGFKYSAVAFAWVKLSRRHSQHSLLALRDDNLHVGLGLTTRHNVELCLLGRRGNARRLAKDVREVILAPVREHSRKPDEVYQRIERYCAGPYLELFARQRRPNWDCWGNEVGKFDGNPVEPPAIEDADPQPGGDSAVSMRGADLGG